MSDLRNAMQYLDSKTQNDAVTNSTTGNACLDFFFKAGGYRGKDIRSLFFKAFDEDEDKAIRLALWLRDIKEGAGERELFRDIFFHLGDVKPNIARKLIPHIPRLGRWDDLLSFHANIQKDVISFIAMSLEKNADGLCAKWMPREKSSKGILGYLIRTELGYTSRQYRRLLSSLSKTVEQDMSSNRWDKINYSHVPSQAMKNYTRAFHRHDHDRFSQYLDDVLSGSGNSKMNAGAIHPHEIIGSYIGNGMDRYEDGRKYNVSCNKILDPVKNKAIEAQWKSQTNYLKDIRNSSICVCDTSGSMRGLPIKVAVSLSIYFAERNEGPFKDEFITFSSEPAFQALYGSTLQQKVHNLLKTNWDANTDLIKVFKLMLKRAKGYSLSDNQLPKNIIIISDMEFDIATKRNHISNYEAIYKEYIKNGYTVPRIIFWNVNSINDHNMPVKQHDHGVSLVSGFSPSILDSIMKDGLDTPLEVMLNKIMRDRYAWNISNRERDRAI